MPFRCTAAQETGEYDREAASRGLSRPPTTRCESRCGGGAVREGRFSAAHRWQVLIGGLAFAAATLAAPLSEAQESERVAQAADPELHTSEPDAPPRPRPASNIEEIVVRGTESEAMSDFAAADSVTGFGAEDLAALGAQDIADLAAFTPNLEIVTSGATTPTFFIRGVGLNDFNANSTGAVAIYADDVALNAPALQLGTLFDVERVNVLRGPQGTGFGRNASAGAIKLYSRKPTGDIGGYLRSELGNFAFRDFEGALEAPVFEDMLAGRFAFRFTQRDGTMENRCGDAPAFDDRVVNTGRPTTDPPVSICGEPVGRNTVSPIPVGLARYVNDINNWGARGTLVFRPTLDMEWLVNAHGSRRDEFSRLGQSYGTNGFTCENDDVENCFPGTALAPDNGSRVLGSLGGQQSDAAGYRPPEVKQRLAELAPCLLETPPCRLDSPNLSEATNLEVNNAKVQVAHELARDLDSEPWKGDFNRTGKTTNDTWGVYLNGEVALPLGIQLNSVTGYDTYDRRIDIDLDFSPETLFQIVTDDEGWQVTQDLQLRGQVDLSERLPIRWDVGAWVLREKLKVMVSNDLGKQATFGVGMRDYTQDLWSAAGYVSLAFDFWDNFTLDGGIRYNWERKTLDYLLIQGEGSGTAQEQENLDESWSAPTGTIRLTYRFREDTHVYWKYTRGWKPGTYNATSSLVTGVSVADPETIDAFESGVHGSWLDGRLSLDFSAFYYSYKDYQLFTAQQFADGSPEFVILNADNAQVYGAEIDAVARPWVGAFANVRFGWLESEFLDFVQIQQENIRQPGGQFVTVNRELNNTGNRLLNSPQFKVSLTAEQTLPLGRFGSISARYDGTWTDVTFFDATEGRGIPNVTNLEFLPEETIAQRAFWLHNLLVSYRLPGGTIEFSAWVRNLTNKAYKTFGFDGSTFNQTTIYFVGDPRTIGGTMVVNF